MNFADELLKELPSEVRTYIRALEAKASDHEKQVVGFEKQVVSYEKKVVGYEKQVVSYENKIGILQQHIERLEEQFRLAQLKRFAPSSEKLGAQGCLFNEAEASVEVQPDADDAEDADDEAEDDTSVPKKKRGRKPLPTHLKRVRIEHDLADADKVCACCDGALHRMGEEVSEQLHIVPAKVEVLQHVRFKYACRQCEQHGIASNIITSAMPAQPIPRSIASASTVAAAYSGQRDRPFRSNVTVAHCMVLRA